MTSCEIVITKNNGRIVSVNHEPISWGGRGGHITTYLGEMKSKGYVPVAVTSILWFTRVQYTLMKV